MEKWINCKHCGHYYSNKLRRCPECGSMTPPGVKQIASAAVIVAAVAAAGVGFFLGINDKGNNISQPPESSDVSVLSSEQSGLPPETDSGTDSVLSSESLSPSQPDSPTESKNPAPEIKKENSEKSTGAEKTESAVSKPSPPKPPESSTLPETVPSGDEVEDIDAADREEITTEPGETCVDLTYSVELADLLRELSDTPLTELTEEDKENGMVSVTDNPDGSLTIRFTEQGFENYKADIRGEILLGIDEIKAAANSQTASFWLAIKSPVRSPKASCKPLVSACQVLNQPGLMASRMACPASWETISPELPEKTCCRVTGSVAWKKFKEPSSRE